MLAIYKAALETNVKEKKTVEKKERREWSDLFFYDNEIYTKKNYT